MVFRQSSIGILRKVSSSHSMPTESEFNNKTWISTNLKCKEKGSPAEKIEKNEENSEGLFENIKKIYENEGLNGKKNVFIVFFINNFRIL